MRIENAEGQVSLFDLGLWSGRTSPARSPQTGDGISKSSSKKQSESRSRTRPTFHVLKNGQWLTPTLETDGPSPTAYSTRSFGESPKDAVESRLSRILEANPLPKYYLSAKACLGILRRAAKRGKKLPPELEAALIRQSQETLTAECDGSFDPEGRGGNIVAQEVIPIHDKATRCQGGGATRNGDGSGNGLGVGKDGDPCPTLSTADRHAVYDARGNGDGKTINTITGDHESRVTDYSALVMAVGLDSEYNAYPELYGTLKAHASGGASETVAVAVDCRSGTESSVNGTLQAKESGGYSLNCQNVVRTFANILYGIVRRLTPLECERLQGFPDGWTDIGPWTDGKGKRRKCSDSARYKALGNSIALPPWKWVLKRISAQYERDATLGSLFDGIGGFPLLWEQFNGKGSALWASEIEEFCIAVTRRRFS